MMAKDPEARGAENCSRLDLKGVAIDATSERVNTANWRHPENGRRAVEGDGTIGFRAEETAGQTGWNARGKSGEFTVDGRRDISQLKRDIAVRGDAENPANLLCMLFDLSKEVHK
jgi:hypothetical protein